MAEARKATWKGPALWALAGLAGSLSLLAMASAGLVLLPIVVPLVILIYVLIELRIPGVAGVALGILGGIDAFAVALALDPPCSAPTLSRLPDGSFETGCAQSESLLPLLLGAATATLLVVVLVWARARGRRSETKTA